MTEKIEHFPGIGLRSSDFENNRVLYTTWRPNAQYAWDAGVAIGKYLAELKRGRLIGAHCRHCQSTMIPPRTVCEWCFKPINKWVELEARGTVNTFSICYVSWDMQRPEVPEISAVIDIEGTSPKMGIMHLLGDVDPGDVVIGMPVTAVWKPEAEREGAITDIRYFRPLS